VAPAGLARFSESAARQVGLCYGVGCAVASHVGWIRAAIRIRGPGPSAPAVPVPPVPLHALVLVACVPSLWNGTCVSPTLIPSYQVRKRVLAPRVPIQLVESKRTRRGVRSTDRHTALRIVLPVRGIRRRVGYKIKRRILLRGVKPLSSFLASASDVCSTRDQVDSRVSIRVGSVVGQAAVQRWIWIRFFGQLDTISREGSCLPIPWLRRNQHIVDARRPNVAG
jgi:hypothetical protein